MSIGLVGRGHRHSLVEFEVPRFAGIMGVVFPPLQAALMYIQFHLSFQVRFQMLLHLDKNEIAPFVSHASVGKGSKSNSPRAALEPRFIGSAQLPSQ
jgi:hypothetical protein